MKVNPEAATILAGRYYVEALSARVAEGPLTADEREEHLAIINVLIEMIDLSQGKSATITPDFDRLPSLLLQKNTGGSKEYSLLLGALRYHTWGPLADYRDAMQEAHDFRILRFTALCCRRQWFHACLRMSPAIAAVNQGAGVSLCRLSTQRLLEAREATFQLAACA